jgi:predicted ATPase
MTQDRGSPALVGREATLRALRDVVDAHRVVTLTGPAGVGKTRLVEALIAEREDALFCDLTHASGFDGASSVVAAALGARLVDVKDHDDTAERIRLALHARGPTLLVLDNCEHLPEAAAALVDALLVAEGARVALTSREPLFVADEELFEVSQLAIDDAVALLLARGQQVQPTFGTPEDREAAARVVERLDRLPLAIELFAARLDVLSLGQLEERLSTPLAVLKRAGRDDGRHRSVEAALRCSWELLGDDERQTLLLCATCSGGADVPLLEAVQRELGPARDLLDDVAALQRKHLLYTETGAGGGRRVHLLATVRAFVESELVSSGEADVYADALARAVLDPARPFASADAAGLLALADAFEVVTAVFRRCRQRAPAIAAAAAELMSRHFQLHGPMHAHLDILDEAIAAAGEAGDDERLRTLYTARADVRRKVGRLNAAAIDLDEAAARAHGPVAEATVASSRAMRHMVEGDFAAAEESIDHAIALAERVDDRRVLGSALQRAGAIHLYRGAYPKVEEVCLRALAALEGVADLRAMTNTLTYLGMARLDRGQAEQAEQAFTEAHAMYTSAGDAWSVAVCDVYLAVIQLDRGDLDVALPALETAVQRASEAGHARLEAFAVGMLGVAYHLRGELGRAIDACRRAAGLGLALRDLLSTSIGAAHLAAALAERGGALDEARHFLDTAHRAVLMLPNPTARTGLAALEGIVALAEGDRDAAAALRARAASSELGLNHRLARRLLDRALGATSGDDDDVPVLRVRPDARVMLLPDGERVDLTRRGPLRLIFAGLLAARDEGRAVDVTGLMELGWPGQTISTEAGTARVYTAVRTLRRLGLEGLLVTRDDGYILAEDAAIVVDPDLS